MSPKQGHRRRTAILLDDGRRYLDVEAFTTS
jgi:hypothetical protein